MEGSIYFAAVTAGAFMAYRALSNSSAGSPKATSAVVSHATLAPNALIMNDVSVTTSAKVETPEQMRVTAALIS